MEPRKRDLKKAGKLLIVELGRLGTLIIGLVILTYFPTQITWEINLSIYAGGVALTHLWIFKGMAGNPPPTWKDFHIYAQDSGIPLTVFGWPFVLLIFAPEEVEHALKRKLKVLPVEELAE